VKRIIDKLQSEGIGRKGGIKSGFKYFFLDSKRPVRDKPTIERIRKLAIPPAWQSVAINRSATHQVQAVGRDAKDRWQYRYHADFRARMDRKKFKQMKQFAGRLPIMRKTVTSHLRQKGLTRERVLAAMVRILDTGMIRIGGEESVRDSRHYGLSTLRRRHTTVTGDVVWFDFVGKSGEKHHIDVRDRAVAKVVRELLKLKNTKRIFHYLNDDENPVPATGGIVNDYFKSIVGRAYSVKDFRTWMATVICACALGQIGAKKTKREQQKAVNAALALTAETLGNTPAICRNAYVSPRVFDLYERGTTVDLGGVTVPEPEAVVRWCRGHHPAGRATLRLLDRHGYA